MRKFIITPIVIFIIIFFMVNATKIRLSWYVVMAGFDNPEYQYYAGWMYAIGKIVPQNMDAAFELWTRSAESGNIDAQYYLGGAYYKGAGIEQDYVKADKWFRLVAEHGTMDSAWAGSNLGDIYSNAKGLSQDYKEAYIWYNISITYGDEFSLSSLHHLINSMSEEEISEAAYDLGWMYYKGEAIPENYKLAYAWLFISDSLGHDDAVSLLDIIERKLNSKELLEAKKLADLNIHRLSRDYFIQYIGLDKYEANRRKGIIPKQVVGSPPLFAKKIPLSATIDAKWSPNSN